jgi:two-component system sensor histidine kinase/response regulator
MPVMNGGECCAKIRSLPGGANVPIIGVTAHDDKEEMGKFLDNGMNGCLTKPVNAKQLKRVLNRFTGDVAGTAVYTKKNWMEVIHSKKPSPDKARILLVEDNLMIQTVMRSLLKRLKYENISACNNGKEAISAVSAEHYDLIFMVTPSVSEFSQESLPLFFFLRVVSLC